MKKLIDAILILLPLALSANPGISPYTYCGADPVNLTDPSGCIVEGVTKADAAKVEEDFRSMFPGDEFSAFRNLITRTGKKHTGKRLAHISSEQRNEALMGISLTEDQQALVDLVVNTINSKSKHYIEYHRTSDVLSAQGQENFLSVYSSSELAPFMSLIIERNGGLPVGLIRSNGQEGATIKIYNDTHTVVITDVIHPNGRTATTGHEILGHGRSLSIGGIDQHVEPIRTENLILRVMGIPYQRNGNDHGPKTIVPDKSILPSFR